jgi:hypothetical protein
MPDSERPFSKPKDVYRIAVLGDSYVESLQVDPENNFLARLEYQLNDRYKPRKFEVLNFGVSSYNLGQMLLRFQNLALKFQPDLVVAVVRVDAAQQLPPNPHGGFLYARPSFSLDGDGRLVKDYTVQNLWLKSADGKRVRNTAWLRTHSRIWGVVSSGMERVLGWWQQARAGQIGASITAKHTAFDTTKPHDSKSVGSSKLAAVASSSVSPVTDASSGLQAVVAEEIQPLSAADGCTRYFWPIAEKILADMCDSCTRQNARFCLVRLAGYRDTENCFETELLSQSAARLGIPYLDTTLIFKPLPADYKPDQIWYKTHLTPLGHSLLSS